MEPLDLTLMNDQELMQLLVEENLGAWSEIVKRYGNLVYSIAYQILKNSNDAEDAVQNTFIRLKIYSNKFDHSLPVKPWLSRIASGEAIRIYNQKKNIHKKESGRMETQNYLNHSQDSEVSTQMEQKELEVMVKKAIEMLPELSRVAVTLYYVGGMNQTEIAKELGVSQFSISEKINLGLSKIKAYLAKAGISASITLSPSLLQNSISSQTLPVSFIEKLSHSFPTQAQAAKINAASQVAGKTGMKKIISSVYFIPIFTATVMLGGFFYWNFLAQTATTAPITITDRNAITSQNDEKIFTPVNYKNYVPVTCKFVQFTKDSDMPDIVEGETQVLGGTPKWKVVTQKNGSQLIMRDSNHRDELDGLYLNQDFTAAHVFRGKIHVNGPKNKISFVMSTPMEERKFNDVNAKENGPMVYARRTANVSAMQAETGMTLDFFVYIFPYQNKFISVSIVDCAAVDYQSVVTKQISFIDSNFKFGVISNGKIQITQFQSSDLGKDWDYRQEKMLKNISAEYSEDFFKDIVDKSVSFKIQK